jgi:tripartite-type tricarboxylate transporter receptor subunit TctC
MAGELLNAQAGITMTHVPFTSGALALNAVMAGDVQMYLPGLPVSVPNIKAGKVKALAVTTSKRAPVLAELPTVAEAAIPGFSVPLWYGIFANQAMSDTSMRKLASDLNKAVKTADIQNKIGSSGIDLVGSSPEAFKIFVNNEMDLWAQTIKARNLKPD